MLRPRIIPCLLIQKGGLVKTRGFSEPKYIGDPINAVRIFNEKEADELLVLDIDATVEGRQINFDMISKLADECRMPLCFGGGIKSVEVARKIVDMGIEKVAVSSAALGDPSLLTRMASAVGRQSVVAVIDIRRKGPHSADYLVCSHNARIMYNFDPVKLARDFEEAGAGEIVINSIDRDGFMEGYDLDIAARMKEELSVPVTFLGGCGTLEHMGQLISEVGIVGAAAGSLFVFKGKFRAVLINYPTAVQKEKLFSQALLDMSS